METTLSTSGFTCDELDTMLTNQSVITFNKKKVCKTYLKENKFNYLSSVHHELAMHARFQKVSSNCLNYSDVNYDIGSYSMPMLDFALGTPAEVTEANLRRIFFSMSIVDVFNQLDTIQKALKKAKLIHRDLNPGNILYEEKTRTFKLIDFYWADIVHNPQLDPLPSNLNKVYSQNDTLAFNLIKDEISIIHKKVMKEIKQLKATFHKVGEVFYDGSSLTSGKFYHPIDIPEFLEVPFFKLNCVQEYNVIKDTLPIIPSSLLDIGCAAGYFSFNFLRDYKLLSHAGYEHDPNVLNYLKEIKRIFNLNESRFYSDFTTFTSPNSYDVALMLNVHMWLWKQLGEKKTLQLMQSVLRQCKYLYFQTAHKESSGIYTITELKDKQAIEAMLYKAGATDVQSVNESTAHGNAIRYMFLVQGSSL